MVRSLATISNEIDSTHATSAMSSRPMRSSPDAAVASPNPRCGGLCNNLWAGTSAVQTHLHRPFVGVRLPHRSHTDAEGTTSDPLGETLCGHPDPADVATLKTLALGWTDDFFSATRTPAYYPSGPAGTIPIAPEAVPLAGSQTVGGGHAGS
ncbi:hypothetical protein DFR75_10874 [Nocardia ignorata]|uniref:Uncharacterized protein n=2 Tax=Nocardia ignorata TaxID=145285 RepID=A0A4R6P665_NOCIG|nr:hypothetical protein DFR75_10874 [Nocardia ignorata]